jgi:hypothetical protein
LRKRVLLLACAVGAAGVLGLAPAAQAGCTSIKIGDAETKCVEDIVCDVLTRVYPPLCPLTRP